MDTGTAAPAHVVPGAGAPEDGSPAAWALVDPAPAQGTTPGSRLESPSGPRGAPASPSAASSLLPGSPRSKYIKSLKEEESGGPWELQVSRAAARRGQVGQVGQARRPPARRAHAGPDRRGGHGAPRTQVRGCAPHWLASGEGTGRVAGTCGLRRGHPAAQGSAGRLLTPQSARVPGANPSSEPG